MKWPQSLILIRHDVSSYNILKQLKENDPLYQEFVRSFEANSNCKKTRRLARKVASKFALGVSDQDTTLASEDDSRGLLVGQALRASNPLPDIVYLSPYARVLATFERICQSWLVLLVWKMSVCANKSMAWLRFIMTGECFILFSQSRQNFMLCKDPIGIVIRKVKIFPMFVCVIIFGSVL